MKLIQQNKNIAEVFRDSKICQDINIKRTKCTEVIKIILYKKETDDLVQHLRENQFSVLVDESTDIGDYKSLAVLVRQCRLLQLVQVDAMNLGATNIYNAFKSCLERHNIPLHNIVDKNIL